MPDLPQGVITRRTLVGWCPGHARVGASGESVKGTDHLRDTDVTCDLDPGHAGAHSFTEGPFRVFWALVEQEVLATE